MQACRRARHRAAAVSVISRQRCHCAHWVACVVRVSGSRQDQAVQSFTRALGRGGERRMSMSMICLLVHEYAYTTQPPPTRAVCPLFVGPRAALARPHPKPQGSAGCVREYSIRTAHTLAGTVQRASVRLPPALAWLILVTALAAACPRRASRRAPSVWLQRQCGKRESQRAGPKRKRKRERENRKELA